MEKYMICNRTRSAVSHEEEVFYPGVPVEVDDISDPWFTKYRDLGIISISIITESPKSRRK